MLNGFFNFVASNAEIIIAFTAVVSTIVFSLLQQKHNKNSVMPVLSYTYSNYDNEIAVGFYNSGEGSMIIDSLHITIEDEKKEWNSFWSCFSEVLEKDDAELIHGYYERKNTRFPPPKKHSVSPDNGHSLILFKLKNELSADDFDKNGNLKDEHLMRAIAKITETLSKISVQIIYYDIYGKTYGAKANEKIRVSDMLDMRYTEYLNFNDCRPPCATSPTCPTRSGGVCPCGRR